MEKEQKKDTKNRLLFGVAGGVIIAIIAIVLIILLGKKEESYRTIRVTEVTGKVTVNRGNLDDLDVNENMNLLSGDEVLTGPGAKMTLRLDDDKYIVVDENTKLLLFAEGTEEDSKTRLEVEYGAVFSDIKSKLSESSDYKVVTPSSTMSVRGTQFEVVYRELRDAKGAVTGKEMKILTFDGAVEVAPEGKDEVRLSSAGMVEVLTEEGGEYKFDGETRLIEAADLSEMSATYLREDISEHYDEMSEEEQIWKKQLFDMAEEYLEEILPEIKAGGEGNASVEITPTPTPEPTPSPTPTPEPTPSPTPEPTYEEETFVLENHRYQFIPLDGRTWEEIKVYCEENGGHLATILSAAENDFLYQKMVEEGYAYAYFGCTDEVTEGEWKWISGEAVTYENWYASDVDNYREEDYAMIWTQRPGYWNDGGLRESARAAFICEWEEEKTPKPVPAPIPPEPQLPKPPVTPQENTDRIRVRYHVPMPVEEFRGMTAQNVAALSKQLAGYSWMEQHAKAETLVRPEESVGAKLTEVGKQHVEQGAVVDAAVRLYGNGTTVTCDGWYDANGKFYSPYGGESFSNLGVSGGEELTLYASYTIHTAGGNITCIPFILDIKTQTGNVDLTQTFLMGAQTGSGMVLPRLETGALQWTQNGTVLSGNEIWVSGGGVNRYGLSVKTDSGE